MISHILPSEDEVIINPAYKYKKLTIKIGNTIYEKHFKYEDDYKMNEEYWGLGIENEIYLEFENKKELSIKEFMENHKRERYSVDYYSIYKTELLKEAFENTVLYFDEKIIDCPVLINSHSFTKTDSLNNSKTLYTKAGGINSKFKGTTLLEDIFKTNKYLEDSFGKEWLFDGDTIEFTTLNFYKTNLENVTKELINIKNNFITNLQNYQLENNLFMEYGKINFMTKNNPFSIFMTNINNVAMFNNGTLHYNITLPTYLDDNKKIVDKNKFIIQHQNYIKIIQWFEPLFIAVYNTPDPFATIENFKNKNKFSNCSQRCAVSRYISIGTYDSDKMIPGKLLSMYVNQFEFSKNKNWWFNKYNEDSAYNKLEEIGLDINFNKHYNHGIELRFFDYISDIDDIYESFEFVIYLADFILETTKEYYKKNPIYDETWNDLVYNTMINGINQDLTREHITMYEKILDIEIVKTNIVDVYYEILWHFVKKYNDIYTLTDSRDISSENKYMLKPIGKFSEKCLTIRHANKKYYNFIFNKNIKIQELVLDPILTFNNIFEVKKSNSKKNLKKSNSKKKLKNSNNSFFCWRIC